MSVLVSLRQAAAVSLAVVGLMVVPGCGTDDGIETRYPVIGTVTHNGNPVANGTINFTPEGGKGRAASGAIKDGSYSMTTLSPGDGVVPGNYKVSITADEQTEESKKIAMANAHGGGMAEPHDVLKAVKKRKRLVPAKYGLPSSSGLTTEVKAESNVRNFDLST